MKSITQFAVKYPVTVAMIVMGTLLLGYISFGKLGMDLFPNLKSPKIYVEVKSGERPPEEMEEVIVNKVRITSYNVCYTKLLRVFFFSFDVDASIHQERDVVGQGVDLADDV